MLTQMKGILSPLLIYEYIKADEGWTEKTAKIPLV